MIDKQKLFNKRFKLAYQGMKKFIVNKLSLEYLVDSTFYMPDDFQEGSCGWSDIAKYLGYSSIKEIHKEGFVLTRKGYDENEGLKIEVRKIRNGEKEI